MSGFKPSVLLSALGYVLGLRYILLRGYASQSVLQPRGKKIKRAVRSDSPRVFRWGFGQALSSPAFSSFSPRDIRAIASCLRFASS